MMNDLSKRVLIIGTVPYRQSGTSRALDSFFHDWDNQDLHQIFSDRNMPFKGHCSSLFQITDVELIKARLSRKEVGTIFNRNDLIDERQSQKQKANESSLISICFKIGKKRTALTHLIRRMVWKKKYWLSKKMIEWVTCFNPECLFLSISDDFFIQDIGLYFANLFQIPIICQIDDDYIFNRKRSINPLYHLYKHMYENQIKEVMSKKTSAVYICDKIRDVYNAKYGIKGETIFLSSSIVRRPFIPINCNNPLIVYFGNIRLDRNKSLIDIANALFRINKSYYIEIYSDETDAKYIKPLKKCKNIHFCGSIPYEKVIKKTLASDLLLVVEGFSKNAIRSTKYSLSTKVADAVCSGANLFAYGTSESGAISYLKDNGCATVCCEKEGLVVALNELLKDIKIQKNNYDMSFIASKNHDLKNNNAIFKRIITEITKKEQEQ